MRFSWKRIVTVAVITVLATAATVTGVALKQQGGNGRAVVAQFASAAPLVTGNEVKVHGAVVGKVQAIQVRGDHADVLLQLEPSALPLHQDARMTVRPVSLLGERYVELEPGSSQAPVLDPGKPIPQSQTGSNVDMDQVLNVLNDPTSEKLAALVTGLGEGMRGNGNNADATIKALAPALRDTSRLSEILRGQNDLLNTLVDRVEPVAGALAADQGKSMDQVVGGAERLLAATSAQQQQLDQTLAELPSALQSARTTLRNLEGAAHQATPMLEAMRPATDHLKAISGELTRFAGALDPALVTAKPVLQRAQTLLEQAKPVAASLRAAGPGLRSTTASARPVVEELSGNLDNVFNFIRYWALTTNGRDGLSHYFRVNLIVNPATATGQLPGGTPAPRPPGPGGDARPPLPEPPNAPGLPPSAPGLPPSAPGLPAPPSVSGLLQPPPAGVAQLPPGTSATGLTPQQEQGLMGVMLGGGS